MNELGVNPYEFWREASYVVTSREAVRSSAQLRRAISTAYYAVFHQIGRHVAREIVGDHTSAAAHAVVRWLTHSDLRALADFASGAKSRPSFTDVLRPTDELRLFSAAFGELQDARHSADYDHDYDVAFNEVFRIVTLAHRSLLRSEAMGADESYRLFLRLALGAVRIARQR